MFRSQAAVIGTGFIGPVHIEGLIRAGVRVRGVLGSSLAKSEETAGQFGLEKAYGTLEELLADPLVNVVHITSPNRHHFHQTIQSLDAGKHVLCEKPLAMNSTESAELVRRASQSHLKTGVNYNVRYYPLCIEASERIRAGEVGEVYHVTGSYVQDWLHQRNDFNWRVLSSEGGSLRAMADIGTHWLDLVQTITGLRVTAVCADLQTVHPTRLRPEGSTETFTGKLSSETKSYREYSVDTEDYGALLLRFENGSRGSVHVSQVTAGHKNTIRFEVAGSKKSLAWNSQCSEELWIGNRNTSNETLLRDPGLISQRSRMHTQYPGGHSEGFPDTFKQLFRAFYSAIEHTQQPPHDSCFPYPTFDDGHREILLCEAILKSAHEQRWIEV